MVKHSIVARRSARTVIKLRGTALNFPLNGLSRVENYLENRLTYPHPSEVLRFCLPKITGFFRVQLATYSEGDFISPDGPLGFTIVTRSLRAY
jgi:hypothetical protein